MSKAITSKTFGTELFASGFFGNHLRQWTVTEFVGLVNMAMFLPTDGAGQFLADKYVIRQRIDNSAGKGVCFYNQTWSKIFAFLSTHCGYGAIDESTIYINDQFPGQPDCITFQGEYIQGSVGDHLLWSTEKEFYRPAMERCQRMSGPGCRPFIRQFLDHRSYENLMILAECYPDHAIEFTVGDRPAGNLGLNTIIWEVRKY